MSEIALGLPVSSSPQRPAGTSSGPSSSGQRDGEFSGILDRGARAAERPGPDAYRRGEAAREDAETGAEEDAILSGKGEEDAGAQADDPAPVHRFGGFAALRLPFDVTENGLRAGADADADADADEEAANAPVPDGNGDGAEAGGKTPSIGLAQVVPPQLAAGSAARGTRADRAEHQPRTGGLAAETQTDASDDGERPAETRRETLRPGETQRPSERAGQDQFAENRGFRRSMGPDSLPIKVNVLAEANNIATAGPQNAQTVASLASAIASDGDWIAAARQLRTAASGAETPAQGPVRDLRIQLNPASLGEVNARLRISGEQLTVEIRVDNSEALQRLSSDREAIATALRGLGFKVDDVTIVQQQGAAATGQNGAGGRDGGAAAGLSQGSGREQDGQSGAGREGRNANQGRQNADAQAHRAGADAGGVYI